MPSFWALVLTPKGITNKGTKRIPIASLSQSGHARTRHALHFWNDSQRDSSNHNNLQTILPIRRKLLIKQVKRKPWHWQCWLALAQTCFKQPDVFQPPAAYFHTRWTPGPVVERGSAQQWLLMFWPLTRTSTTAQYWPRKPETTKQEFRTYDLECSLI